MPVAVTTVDYSAVTRYSNGRLRLLTEVPGCRATCATPDSQAASDLLEPLALDIEFQEYKRKGDTGWSFRMGRVALVNTRGGVVYDTYVHYPYEPDVEKKLPKKALREKFKVDWRDIKVHNGAKEAEEVHRHLRKLFRDRTIIGHGMHHDINAVGDMWAETTKIVDTQDLYGPRGLEYYAQLVLKERNFVFHDPTEDAKATMLLYLRKCPYQDRTDFNDAPPKNDEANFPALGA